MKKAMNKKGKITLLSSAIALVTAATVTINILAMGVFSNAIAFALGGIALTKGDASTLDTQYYKSQNNEAALKNKQLELSRKIAANGTVLLQKSEDSSFPFASGTKFSLFSHSSVDWVAGGTGSGGGTSKHTLKSAMEEGGFQVNDTLWDFYSSGNGKNYTRGEGSLSYGDKEDYSINECPRSVIEGEAGLVSSFKGTKAMFVISRTGGEGRDLARSMVQHTKIAEDQKKHYLEPDSVELGVISYLQENKDIDEIVLVVNCNNAIELGWTSRYDKIKTVLQVPGTGADGIVGFVDVLNGTEAPSGRLVDTFAYDSFSSPAMQNFDESLYLLNGQKPNGDDRLFYYYMVYAEGIYVGYQYYETRYEDQILGQGNATSQKGSYGSENGWNYAEEVQYPFGYGLSTTEFEWTNYTTSWEGDTCTVSLDVKNVGDITSRDVVEIYAQSPYQGTVEKSSVVLVGFAKTSALKKGESETVKVSFSKTDLMSYNEEFGSYVLDDGDYYITAAKDAHAAVNNILSVKVPEAKLIPSPSEITAGNAELVEEFNVGLAEKYDKDGIIGNKLSDSDWKKGFGNRDKNFKYLSRSDWEATYPTHAGNLSDWISLYSNKIDEQNTQGYLYTLDITKEEYDRLRGTDSLNPVADSAISESPVYGSDVDLQLIDMRGLAYDDPAWDSFLTRLKADDLSALISKNGYTVSEAKSVGSPSQAMRDGPKGILYTYPCELLLAQTWDIMLAEEFGGLVGDECLNNPALVSGWFAPAMNIHRTPFAGRNFEYYSEDACVSALFGSATVRGASSRGLITCIKHFAFNDNEAHRGDRNNNDCSDFTHLKGDNLYDSSVYAGEKNFVGDWGICVWLNEQSARQLYLKPFEKVITSGTIEDRYYLRQVDEDGNTIYEEKTYERPSCLGLMTSFNRLGATWTGGHYNLITGILREEWDFDGMIITDFDNGGYMSAKQMIRAGADCKLNFVGETEYDGTKFDLKQMTDNANYYYAKEAAHHILYSFASSRAMNGYIHGVEVTYLPYHYFIVWGIDLIALVGITLLALSLVKTVRKKEQ